MVYYWDFYRQQCRLHGQRRGRYLRPTVGEYLFGCCAAGMCSIGIAVIVIVTVVLFSLVLDSPVMSGLPTGWTKAIEGSVCKKHFKTLFPWYGNVL